MRQPKRWTLPVHTMSEGTFFAARNIFEMKQENENHHRLKATLAYNNKGVRLPVCNRNKPSENIDIQLLNHYYHNEWHPFCRHHSAGNRIIAAIWPTKLPFKSQSACCESRYITLLHVQSDSWCDVVCATLYSYTAATTCGLVLLNDGTWHCQAKQATRAAWF